MLCVVLLYKGIYYYLYMVKGNYCEYLKKDVVFFKKYFYVLRFFLVIMWLECYDKLVFIEFVVLCKLVVDNVLLDEVIMDFMV